MNGFSQRLGRLEVIVSAEPVEADIEPLVFATDDEYRAWLAAPEREDEPPYRQPKVYIGIDMSRI